MLNYYFSVGEAARAFEFFPRHPTKFFDAWTMMQVCLELGRLDEAKKVARYCSGLLATADDDFTRASMADALAAYYVHIGKSDQALKLWNRSADRACLSAATVDWYRKNAAGSGTRSGQSWTCDNRGS